MSDPTALARSLLVWLVPFAIVVAALGFETDWGRAVSQDAPAAPATPPQPVAVALLPEYRIDGGLDARKETVDRVLFNPTRRPAPPATQTAGPNATMKRGQYTLTGTTVVGSVATAFLREVNGGKSRAVRQGETLNGMLVAEVNAGSGAPEAGRRCRGSPVEGRHRAEDNHPDGARHRGAGRSGCAGATGRGRRRTARRAQRRRQRSGRRRSGCASRVANPGTAPADAAGGAAACCARHAGRERNGERRSAARRAPACGARRRRSGRGRPVAGHARPASMRAAAGRAARSARVCGKRRSTGTRHSLAKDTTTPMTFSRVHHVLAAALLPLLAACAQQPPVTDIVAPAPVVDAAKAKDQAAAARAAERRSRPDLQGHRRRVRGQETGGALPPGPQPPPCNGSRRAQFRGAPTCARSCATSSATS